MKHFSHAVLQAVVQFIYDGNSVLRHVILNEFREALQFLEIEGKHEIVVLTESDENDDNNNECNDGKSIKYKSLVFFLLECKMIDTVFIHVGDSSSSSSEDADVTIISVTNDVIEIPSSGDEQTNDVGAELPQSGSSCTLSQFSSKCSGTP